MKIVHHCFLCYIPQQLRAACSIQTIPIDGALCCSRPAHAPVYIARIALHRVSGAGAPPKGPPSGDGGERKPPPYHLRSISVTPP